MLRQRAQTFGVHAILIAYSAIAVGPILLVVMNSFKARSAIFGSPLAPPNGVTFSLIGYAKVLSASHVGIYFANSIVVTLVEHVLRAAVRRDGGLGAHRIQVPRLDAAGAVPGDRRHGADPARLGRRS